MYFESSEVNWFNHFTWSEINTTVIRNTQLVTSRFFTIIMKNNNTQIENKKITYLHTSKKVSTEPYG